MDVNGALKLYGCKKSEGNSAHEAPLQSIFYQNPGTYISNFSNFPNYALSEKLQDKKIETKY